MHILIQMMRHPAGRIGLMIGLIFGLVAAMMGEASKALFFAGLCRILIERLTRS